MSGSFLRGLEGSIGLNFQGNRLAVIVSGIINYLMPFAGFTLMLYLLYGGYILMLSGGDPKKIMEGKTIITHAIVGFLIIFAAFWIAQAVGIVFGLSALRAVFL